MIHTNKEKKKKTFPWKHFDELHLVSNAYKYDKKKRSKVGKEKPHLRIGETALNFH